MLINVIIYNADDRICLFCEKALDCMKAVHCIAVIRSVPCQNGTNFIFGSSAHRYEKTS